MKMVAVLRCMESHLGEMVAPWQENQAYMQMFQVCSHMREYVGYKSSNRLNLQVLSLGSLQTREVNARRCLHRSHGTCTSI